VAVVSAPVSGEPAGGTLEEFRRETFQLMPWKDEEAAVVDDDLEVAGALFRSPADPAVTRRHRPCGTAPLQEGEEVRSPDLAR
jgi:hypothetical protein